MKKIILFTFLLLFTTIAPPAFALLQCQAGYNLITIDYPNGSIQTCGREVPQQTICFPGELSQTDPSTLQQYCTVEPTFIPDPPGTNPLNCANFLTCLNQIAVPGLKTGFTSSTGFVGTLLTVFLPAIIGILAFLAIIFMLIASIRLIISRGDPEKVKEARERLIYVVVGFIVLLLAFAATQIVNRLFLGSSII